jgi:hypothetical protein
VRECPQNEQLGVLGLRLREPPMIRGSSAVDPISFGKLGMNLLSEILALKRP